MHQTLALATVNLFVTRGAKSDQVAFDIVTESASGIDVMHL